MKDIELIRKIYGEWLEMKCLFFENYKDGLNEHEIRLIFLTEFILDYLTYDDYINITFGKEMLETLQNIYNRTTFEYIENEENYKKYINCINFIQDWLEWGTSVRGAWFRGKMKIEHHDGKEYCINVDNIFMRDFINFLLVRD